MSNVRELHNKAMELAQKAMVASHKNNAPEAIKLAKEAFSYEFQAADLVPYDKSSEPTRSILYRSAASLALQAKEFSKAQYLIAKGMSGFPPPEIQVELNKLYEQVNFERHLDASDLVLSEEEVTFTVLGDAVMYGAVLFDEFIKRLNTFRMLIDRTTQREMKKPYKRSGPVSKEFKPFIPVLSVEKAASFTIKIKLAKPSQKHKQTKFDFFVPEASEVIDSVVIGLEMIDKADDKSLKELIKDESYYKNFRSLARDMAPDGERINFIGFITPRKSVSLTLTKKEISADLAPVKVNEEESVDLEGVLDFATSRDRDIIGLTDVKGDRHSIMIEEGMDDLVKSYFNLSVRVKGYKRGRYVFPTDIDGIDE